MTVLDGVSVRGLWRSGELQVGALLVAVAAMIAYLIEHHHERTAMLVAALPAAVLLALSFRLAAVLLAISLPFPVSLLGGGGLNVAASDVLLALLLVVVVAEGLGGHLPGIGRAVKSVVLACSPYLAWSLVLLAAHASVSTVLQTAQRLELFIVPVLVGAAIALRGHEWAVLRSYLAISTVFAGLYPVFSTGAGGMGVQKNPAGQFIANALILLIALKPLRNRWTLGAIPVLTIGLLWTQSRGAILSVAIALVVLIIMHCGRERVRLLVLLVPLAACAALAFTLLPEEAQERNTDFSTASGTDAARSLEIREEFKEQAWGIIEAEPVFGVGIGNYVQGVPGVHPTTVDPHQVMLLQAAEGGYPFAAGFVVMVVGAVALLFRFTGRTPLAATAGALLIAAVGHGLVDVYWVRGTPVLSWLTVGMVVGTGVTSARAIESVRRPTSLATSDTR